MGRSIIFNFSIIFSKEVLARQVKNIDNTEHLFLHYTLIMMASA